MAAALRGLTGAGLGLVLALAWGCRSSGPGAGWIEVPPGPPAAFARCAVQAAIDSPEVARGAPRVGEGDPRLVVRMEEAEPAGSGTLAALRTLVRSHLLASGRFLVLPGRDGTPAAGVEVGTQGPLGHERALLRLLNPSGEALLQVRGDLLARN